MNILFITPDFYPNSTGFANASINLINSIITYSNNKYKIYVFTDQDLKGKKELEKIEVIRYKQPVIQNKFNRIKRERNKFNLIDRVILEKKIDIIFFETNTFPFVQNWVLDKYTNRVFVRIHSTADTEVPIFGKCTTIGSKISNKKMYDFMERVPNIVSTSNYYIDFVKKYYLRSNVYTMWDNKSYGLLYNTSTFEARSTKSIKSNHFMTMGKMSSNGVTQKGITDLLRAVSKLNSDSQLPDDFKLTIVGDGECYDRIFRLVENYGLTSYIKLIKSASHDDVFELMANCKAIVLLSRYEGQSMFVTEAISLGKPLILTKNNGMQEMLIEDVNGYGVTVGDTEEIAEKLLKFMNLDDSRIKDMGYNSRQLYENKFSPEAIYKQFDRLMSDWRKENM